METINNIELKDPNIYPSDDVLMSILGNSFSAYKELLNLFVKHELEIEWRYSFDAKEELDVSLENNPRLVFGCQCENDYKD